MVNGRKEYVSIVILFVINLLNYVDRYTVAGVLTEVQDYYDIDDGMAGMIQTVFLVFFMFGSPICGYLGDRYNRKWIIFVGVIIWIGAVAGSTFVPADQFWLFLLFRGIVGIGEASYSNVSPSLISDMFTGVARSRMYMLFYFAVPVGSGLGFVVGSNVASLTGQWQWGVRVTACAGAAATALLVFFVHEPERGGADAVDGGAEEKTDSSYWEDLKALVKIPTYVACTIGYTCLVFVTGTLTWWEPTIIEHLMAWDKGLEKTDDLPQKDSDSIGLLFGGITTISGLVGVTLGTLIAGWWKNGTGPFRCIKTPRSQPLVSGTGAAVAAPLLAIAFLFGHHSLVILWVLMGILILFLSLNWGLNVDMLMGVIVPSRRSTAFSYFMLFSHLFGDATGPYLIGVISDKLRNGKTDPKSQYQALIKASAVTVPLLVISAVMYYITAMVLVRDQKRFRTVMGQAEEVEPRTESPDSLTKLKKTDSDSDSLSNSSMRF